MKLIIDIPEEAYNRLLTEQHLPNRLDIEWCIVHGTPIPDNATNGDVIKAMLGDDKVSEFIGHVWIMARVGNWFNDGVVAEFDKDWWNAPYQKGGKE